MSLVEVSPGTSPFILAFPHAGTAVPPEILERLNDRGRLLADTDWHLDTLYHGLLPGATTVRATFHRYVIDANRDPAGGSLYPGQNTTGLVPETNFEGDPIWRAGQEPTSADVAGRLAEFHAGYHAALAAEIARVQSFHGAVVLYDCHSIRSHIPFLFPGVLPDFNIGTGFSRRMADLPGTCCAAIESAAVDAVQAAEGYTHVLNGRFKGGWTVRHYGNPERDNVHAIQMELAQSTYLGAEAPPFAFDPAKAKAIRVHLQRVLERIEAVAFDL